MYQYISKSPLILASASPRRKELLESAGLKFTVLKPACDESVLENEGPEIMVKRLSEAKAAYAASLEPNNWILSADTTVYIDGRILGKPSDRKEASEMLETLSGRWHEVWGGIAICHIPGNFFQIQAHCTKVLMRKLNHEDISKFVASGEPMDKAGGYAIQGIGASLVSEIQGSYTNVVGLNLSAVITCFLENKLIK
jgi:septum formation protein